MTNNGKKKKKKKRQRLKHWEETRRVGVDWHYEHICVASTAACVGGVSIETRSLLRRPDSSVDAPNTKKSAPHDFLLIQTVLGIIFSLKEETFFFSHKTRVWCLLLARLSGHEVVAGCLYSQSGGTLGGGNYSKTVIL